MDAEILQEYRKKVVGFVIAIVCFSATAAAIVLPGMKLFGLYPAVSWLLCGAFIGVIVLEDALGICIIRQSMKQEVLSEQTEKLAKNYLLVLLILNINLITWCFPSKESWMFSFYFLILMAFFLDMKFVLKCGLAEVISLVILFFANPVTYPVESLFWSDAILRVICITLSLAGVIILMAFIEKFLLNAKKEQLEKNNAKVKQMLERVSDIAGKLGEASSALVGTSQSESASTEELSAISENLLQNNTTMMEKSRMSKENLANLEKSSQDMELKMKDVDQISKELVDISVSNEQALNNLMAMSEEVERSTNETKEVTDKLLHESNEIGATLDIINEIAESINLLSLNASIEAARAGEAGRGFAVVATEVGNLANSTQESLREVELVIERVQNNVREITAQVQENAEKLGTQNQYFDNVFQSMQEMTKLLHVSVDAVSTMGEAHGKQADVIKKTVMINQEIAENVISAKEQFDSINSMAESNANDTADVATQASDINEMVDEISRLLKTEEE